jgi:hypothetical protein
MKAKKNTLRITESKLKNLISESVKKVLREQYEEEYWFDNIEKIEPIIKKYGTIYQRTNMELEEYGFQDSFGYRHANHKFGMLCKKIAQEINDSVGFNLVYVTDVYGEYMFESNFAWDWCHDSDRGTRLLELALLNNTSLTQEYNKERRKAEERRKENRRKEEEQKVDISSNMDLKYAPRIDAKIKPLGKMDLDNYASKEDTQRWRTHVTKN